MAIPHLSAVRGTWKGVSSGSLEEMTRVAPSVMFTIVGANVTDTVQDDPGLTVVQLFVCL